MNHDYLLIAVDRHTTCAVRFVSLGHAIAEELVLHAPQGQLRTLFAEFLLGAVLLGSRQDDQETTFFKLALNNQPLQLNCEVASTGQLRATILPGLDAELRETDLRGELQVVKLTAGGHTYESRVGIQQSSMLDTFRHYLKTSQQSDSLLLMQADAQHPERCYALWVERLPATSDDDWKRWCDRLADGTAFSASVASTHDPDLIVQALFPETIQIMMVTRPDVTCSCSKDRILDALRSLSDDDLVELFMDAQGVRTTCDYCRREWHVSDDELKELIGVGKSLH